jgi:WD40 repeat protein
LTVALGLLATVTGLLSEEPRKPSVVIPTQGWFTSAAFSPNGRLLAAAEVSLVAEEGYREGAAVVRLYEVATMREVAILKGHLAGIGALAFSEDGHTLGSMDRKGTVKLWDVASRKEEVSVTLDGFFDCVAFHPDLRTVATVNTAAEIHLWDLATEEVLAVLATHCEPNYQPAYRRSLAFSPSGKVIASGYHVPSSLKDGPRDGKGGGRREELPGDIKVWDTTSQKEVAGFKRKDVSGHVLAWSPDGQILAYRFPENSGPLELVRLWNLTKEQEVVGPDDFWPYTLAFSPDGKKLGGIDINGKVLVWDRFSGERWRLAGLSGPGGAALCFSPDGKTIATTGSRGLLVLDLSRAPKPIHEEEK